jgi:hypothetical protein
MTDQQRISRAIHLSSLASESERRWPDAPHIASNLRWAAQYQLSRVARRAA